jgi:nucleoside-diphosphate-sugar epimerase
MLLAGRYTLLDHELALRRLMPAAATQGVDIVIGGPYSSGVLAGGAHFEYQPAPPEISAKVERIRAIAERHGVPIKAAALHFVLAHPRSFRSFRVRADSNASQKTLQRSTPLFQKTFGVRCTINTSSHPTRRYPSTDRGKIMKVLVTGATGYLGAVAAEALATRGHQVSGLARSERSAGALRKRGIEPVAGDFGDPVSLANAVHEARPDVVVSTASVGGASGDHAAFARDGEAVCAMREALTDHGGSLVFTSGSAVFGVFNRGDATDTVYDEDARLPLPASVFAPASAGVHPLLAAGFEAAMAARVETERAVLADGDVRGVVVRPGLVYGRGGNSDLRSLIDRARKQGRAGHWGSGGTTQSYVHVEDLAELFCLAAELAPHGAILHGVADDVTQRDLARAINRMIGTDEHTDSLSLLQMLGIDADTAGNIGGSFTPPPSAASGISLSLNKRLSSDKTRKLLGWSPKRTDVCDDIAVGSYANT